MTLIDEILDRHGMSIKFYFGIDFNKILNHSKDGSDGFIFCFIDKYEDEVKLYARNEKIESLLQNRTYNIDETKELSVDNNYVSIYQTGNLKNEVYQSVRKRLIEQNNIIS